jgi:hypothetical protein
VEVDRNFEDFRCDTCMHKHCTEEPTEQWPESRGQSSVEIFEIPNVISSRTCLKPMVTANSRFVLELYTHSRDGHLPVTGGVMDQPAVLMDAFRVIKGALSK